MGIENYLKQAKMLYQRALEEFNKAKGKNDGTILRDACGKGWLSAIEGYYDGTLSFDEVERHLDDLDLYIQKIEGAEPRINLKM
jgi:hypothetical protein